MLNGSWPLPRSLSCYMLHASCAGEPIFLSVWMLLFWVVTVCGKNCATLMAF